MHTYTHGVREWVRRMEKFEAILLIPNLLWVSFIRLISLHNKVFLWHYTTFHVNCIFNHKEYFSFRHSSRKLSLSWNYLTIYVYISHIHISTYTYMYLCVCVCVCIYISIHTCTHIFIDLYKYIYTNRCIHTYTYVCIHTHTHLSLSLSLSCKYISIFKDELWI